jgi:hypothetical protein
MQGGECRRLFLLSRRHGHAANLAGASDSGRPAGQGTRFS